MAAVKLFDFVHSVDSIKLAKKIAEEQNKIQKNIKIFLQVNIGNEHQKAGININEAEELLKICLNLKLTVLGLMCLPPIGMPPKDYFIKLKQKNDELNESVTMHQTGHLLLCPVRSLANIVRQILSYPDGSEDMYINTFKCNNKYFEQLQFKSHRLIK